MPVVSASFETTLTVNNFDINASAVNTSAIKISAVLSTASLYVEENMLKTVICRTSSKNYEKTKSDLTLEWFDEDGSLVPSSQNDRDHQIAFYGSSFAKDPAAFLFVSGKGKFTIHAVLLK